MEAAVSGKEAHRQPPGMEGKSNDAGCGENDQGERCCIQAAAHPGLGFFGAGVKRPLRHRLSLPPGDRAHEFRALG